MIALYIPRLQNHSDPSTFLSLTSSSGKTLQISAGRALPGCEGICYSPKPVFRMSFRRNGRVADEPVSHPRKLYLCCLCCSMCMIMLYNLKHLGAPHAVTSNGFANCRFLAEVRTGGWLLIPPTREIRTV
jgi:hypothetical protein